MDASNVGYIEMVDESSSSDESSSESELSPELFTSNRGSMYQYQGEGERMMNNRKAQEYISIRNKYFTPEITRHSLLIDTQHHDSQISKNNFVAQFRDSQEEESVKYAYYPVGEFVNVIGFRLIKACVPNRLFAISDETVDVITSSTHSVSLVNGSYTGDSFAQMLEDKLQTSGIVGASVSYSTGRFVFNSGNSAIAFGFDFTNNPRMGRFLGFVDSIVGPDTNFESTTSTYGRVHFVDIVINDIPHAGCKKNSRGLNIVDRISLYTSGTLTYYENKQLIYQNYFSPIKLSKLHIELVDDIGNHYAVGDEDSMFEFEITTLNHVE
jgi:hypothetical protein